MGLKKEAKAQTWTAVLNPTQDAHAAADRDGRPGCRQSLKLAGRGPGRGPQEAPTGQRPVHSVVCACGEVEGLVAWEKHIFSSPAGGLCGARLLVSKGILLSCVGGPGDPPLSQSLTAAARKAVIPLVLGQRELASAQMLHSLSPVRVRSSLRC